MPSVYTEPIYNGEDITFEQFANSCLRNFGIALRWEESANIGRFEIPDKIEPNLSYEKKYEEAIARYAKFIKNPPSKEQLEQEYDEYVKSVNAENKDYAERVKALRGRYEAMLAKVTKWEVPSENYQRIKDFMVNQLLESIEKDCCDYIQEIIPKEKWIAFHQNRNDLVDNIEYCRNMYKKAVLSAIKSTMWLRTFAESVRKVDEE